LGAVVVITAVVACVPPYDVPRLELDRAGFTVMLMAAETELVKGVLNTALAGIIGFRREQVDRPEPVYDDSD